MAAEFYGLFDSTSQDRRVNTDADVSRAFRMLSNDGVKGLGENLRVSPDTGLRVKVGFGAALCRGYCYELMDDGSGDMQLAHDFSEGAPRADRIVLRMDLGARKIGLFVKKGVQGTSPVPPELTREGILWELSLAQVRIAAGQQALTASDIVDERNDPALCGQSVTSLVSEHTHNGENSTRIHFNDLLDIPDIPEPNGGDAATLGGHPPAYYATASKVTNVETVLTDAVDGLAGAVEQVEIKLADSRMAVGSNLLTNGAMDIWQRSKVIALNSTTAAVPLCDGFWGVGVGIIEANKTFEGNIAGGMLISATQPIAIIQEIQETTAHHAYFISAEFFTSGSKNIQFGSEFLENVQSGKTRLVASPYRAHSPLDHMPVGPSYFLLWMPAGQYSIDWAQCVSVETAQDVPDFHPIPRSQSLLDCQRYYRIVPYNMVGLCLSTSDFVLFPGLSMGMVKAPTASLTSKAGVANGANHMASETEISGITASMAHSSTPWSLWFNKAGLTQNGPIFANVTLDATTAPPALWGADGID
jgi:hypothetical protein